MNSENSMRPSCRETNMEGGEHLILAVLSSASFLSCYDVLDAFGRKWGQTLCSKSRAIFAPAPGSLLRQKHVTCGH